MKNKIYGCNIADSALKTSVRKWLVKNNYKNTLNVPIRRNCMTGSGKVNECHRNVQNLVLAYGGKRLVGYSVQKYEMDRLHLTVLSSHSVWITPEGNAVDVTAHHYSDNAEFSVFLPIISGKRIEIGFPDIALPEEYIREGVWVDYREDELNKRICHAASLRLAMIGDAKSFVVMPASKFNRRILPWESDMLSGAELAKDLRNGGFDSPSTASGKNWEEIFNMRVLPKIIPNKSK